VRTLLTCCVVILLGAVSVSRADTLPLLDAGGFFAFPGALPGPASAASAGLGLADRWAGDEPFDNPAASPERGVLVAPVLQRVKRQDLTADYRNYDETAGYFDFAGGRLSLPVRGFGVTLYASQPVLRSEEQSFTTKPGVTPPASYTVTGEARELRAGLAASHEWRGGRLGLGVEWTHRDDSYEGTNSSSLAGSRSADFSGDAVGFQAGAIVPAGERVLLGAALRYVPALEVSGSSWAGADVRSIAATRDAGLEGGVSARVGVTAAVRAIASVGGSTAREWDGFGLTEGRMMSWGLGLECGEADQPLTVRCGVGQEQQNGVPEPRTGVFALGLGWRLDPMRLDLAVLRRSLSRAEQPASYDDRVVAGLTVDF
jgi:hypothetical protein